MFFKFLIKTSRLLVLLLVSLFVSVSALYVIFGFDNVCAEVGSSLGVGVGLGRINLGLKLEPGGVYPLPQLPVINTGSVAGEYQVRAEGVKGPAPLKRREVSNWFHFSPQKFYLEPDQSRLVEITITLPLAVPDGTYLVYLEASPVQDLGKGVTIGPVAATKLYFGVESGSVLGAVRTRVLTWILYRSEVYLLLAFFCFLEAVVILRRHYRFRVETRVGL